MYDWIKKGAQLTGFLALFFFCATAQSAFDRELTYFGNLEAHSELDDEVSSILTLVLTDDTSWSRYVSDYDLEISYLYEHQENDDNDRFEGFYNGTYLITQSSSVVWDIIANFEVLPLESGEEIDSFESQNLTAVSTGPTVRLFKSLRGVTELTALVSDIDYSESLLDSTQEEIGLRYIHPLSESQVLTLGLYHFSIEFDDSINTSSDIDSDSFSISYDSSNKAQDISLTIAATDIDNESDPDNQGEFELNYKYRVNPRSTIELDLVDSLQSSAEFNAENPIENNDLFVSSLIRNKRILLGYSYRQNQNLYAATIYSQIIELVLTDDEPEDSVGGSLSFTRRVGREWFYFIELEVSENEFLDDRFESLTALVRYRREHTSAASSELELSVEADETDTTSIEDYILAYRLVLELFN